MRYLIFFGFLFSLSSSAQIPVTDAAAFEQAAEANLTLFANQAKQMKQDLEFITKQGRNLVELGWSKASLKDYITFVRNMKGRVNSILKSYDEIDRAFGGKSGESFQDKRKKWDAMTEESIKTSLMANKIVSEEDLKNQTVDELLNKLDSSENVLQATQALGNLLHIQASQLDSLTTIVAADSRAKQIERAKKHSEKKDVSSHESHMARNWGERKTGVPWKKLPNFSDR